MCKYCKSFTGLMELVFLTSMLLFKQFYNSVNVNEEYFFKERKKNIFILTLALSQEGNLSKCLARKVARLSPKSGLKIRLLLGRQRIRLFATTIEASASL
jgi:hypothetical protein